MADSWIINCQVWLDAQFEGQSGYLRTPQTGQTGWPTMYSLTRAVQLTLGISATSNAFGPTTMTQFQSKIGTIGASTAANYPNIIGILRTALWCKGYAGGYDAQPGQPAFLQWDAMLAGSVAQVRTDLGLSSTGGVDAKLMRSLLAMDAYVTVPGGSAAVRNVQQWMNGRYSARRDFPLIPCDGLYSRQVQTGLLYGLQYEIGMADGTANGNFGPGTQQGVRDYGVIGVGSTDGTRRMVSLFQAALIFNGQTATPFSGSFTTSTRAEMQSFQGFAGLPTTTSANYTVWASLLVSTGDPDRPVAAADTSTLVLPARASTLVNNGHVTIGRYINGTGGKRIAHSEPGFYGNAGLRWFPIYQEWNNEPKWFSYAQGYNQGLRIAARAAALGLPADTVVFLAVDYDATGDEITAIVRPHFEGARAALQAHTSLPLRLGVYGTRNVCTRLAAAGLTAGSFVADMSSGWSGNLGFRLPPDWMYDQIKTVTLGSGDGAIEIDRVARSSRAESLSPTALRATPRRYAGSTVSGYDEDLWWRWAQLATLAETETNVGRIAQASFVLYEAYRKHYGGEAIDSPGSRFNRAFDEIFSPPPDATVYAPFRNKHAELYGDPADGLFGFTINGSFALGDVPHAAVVASTYLSIGLSFNDTEVQIADYASWAGDLMGVWANYETARLSGGGSLDAYAWLRSRVGSEINVNNGFGIRDLRADAAGQIIAHEVRESDESIGDIMRNLHLAINDDPGYLASRFIEVRFGGSYATMVAAAERAVGSELATMTPIADLFDNARHPGAATGAASDPDSIVRDTEINACARAFADAVVEASTTWSLRS